MDKHEVYKLEKEKVNYFQPYTPKHKFETNYRIEENSKNAVNVLQRTTSLNSNNFVEENSNFKYNNNYINFDNNKNNKENQNIIVDNNLINFNQNTSEFSGT